MLQGYWPRHQIELIVFLSVLVAIALSNWWALRQLGAYPPARRLPFLSVLVPARNEAGNIGPCVRSLLDQVYPDYEVLVLDDHSDDGTAAELVNLASQDARVRVLTGEPLPAGWLGKHWACHQLAQAARGELLLFTDADTRHHPETLRDSVAAMSAEGTDLLSGWAQQELGSFGEKLIVPIMSWSVMAFLPLALAHRVRWPALSAANGQFMLFRRPAYDRVGGYAAVRECAVDDLALVRRVKRFGLRWRLVDAGGRVRCRMYRSFRQAYEGFTKNIFAAFGYSILPFLFVWTWLAVVFFEPWVVLLLHAVGIHLSALSLYLALAGIVAALLAWAVPYRRLGFPVYMALAYPLNVGVAIVLALRSMILTLRGQATWKGRTLMRSKVRWI